MHPSSIKRFEIQEMVTQSQDGVAYLAKDKETGRVVALRRFFPYGQDKGGLKREEARNYCTTCQRLTRITHTNLRVVVDGGVDPSDNTPYLATEWVEGYSLKQILAGGTLDPARTIDVVRAALEVSLQLSEAFGEKAVWVDADPDSIVVDSEAMDRGYTFWVCPSRWLNTKPKLRDVKSIAAMAEELTGWNSRAYSKEDGGGFGGWVNTMKSVPCMNVESALLQLNDLFGKKQSEPTAKIRHRPAAKPSPAVTPKPVPKPVARPAAPVFATSSATPAQSDLSQPTHSALSQPTRPSLSGKTTKQILVPTDLQSRSTGLMMSLTVLAACLAVCSVFGYLIIQNRIHLHEQLAKNEAADKAELGAKKMKVDMDASGNSSSPRPIPAGSTQSEPPVQTNAKPTNPEPLDANPEPTDPQPAPPVASGDVPICNPEDFDKAREVLQGAPIKVRGTIASVKFKTGNKDIRAFIKFQIEGKPKFQIMGYFLPGLPMGAVSENAFQSYVGKEVIIEGISKSFGPRSALVEFRSLDQITVISE